MAETLVETRLISGTGVLRALNLESANRYYSVLVDVIRLPSSIDRSFRYSPYRQRFATAVFLRQGYVLFEEAIDYERRRFDFLLDSTGQVLVSLKCAHAQVLDTLGVPSPETASTIADHANLSLIWDEVRFVCFLDTAIQVRFLLDIYDQCGQEYSEKSPPAPPAPLPPVPPGTPIGDITPPYEDDDVTNPYDGDEFPPPPPTEGSWIITVTIAGGGTADLGSYPGQSTDTWSVVTPSPACILPGSSDLIRNGTEPVERPLNCNSAGFVSEIVEVTFTPSP